MADNIWFDSDEDFEMDPDAATVHSNMNDNWIFGDIQPTGTQFPEFVPNGPVNMISPVPFERANPFTTQQTERVNQFPVPPTENLVITSSSKSARTRLNTSAFSEPEPFGIRKDEERREILRNKTASRLEEPKEIAAEIRKRNLQRQEAADEPRNTEKTIIKLKRRQAALNNEKEDTIVTEEDPETQKAIEAIKERTRQEAIRTLRSAQLHKQRMEGVVIENQRKVYNLRQMEEQKKREANDVDQRLNKKKIASLKREVKKKQRIIESIPTDDSFASRMKHTNMQVEAATEVPPLVYQIKGLESLNALQETIDNDRRELRLARIEIAKIAEEESRKEAELKNFTSDRRELRIAEIEKTSTYYVPLVMLPTGTNYKEWVANIHKGTWSSYMINLFAISLQNNYKMAIDIMKNELKFDEERINEYLDQPQETGEIFNIFQDSHTWQLFLKKSYPPLTTNEVDDQRRMVLNLILNSETPERKIMETILVLLFKLFMELDFSKWHRIFLDLSLILRIYDEFFVTAKEVSIDIVFYAMCLYTPMSGPLPSKPIANTPGTFKDAVQLSSKQLSDLKQKFEINEIPTIPFAPRDFSNDEIPIIEETEAPTISTTSSRMHDSNTNQVAFYWTN